MKCPLGTDLLRCALGLTDNKDAAPEEWRSHLERCDSCRSRTISWAQHARRANLAVPSGQGSENCPDENAFAEFLDGVLSVFARRRFERHLIFCSSCLSRLVETGALIRELAEPTPQTIPVLSLQWLKDTLQALTTTDASFTSRPLEPVPVLRGPLQASALSWTIRKDSFELAITAIPLSDQRISLDLVLFEEGRAVPGVTVGLRTEGRLLESRPLSQAGTITFSDLIEGEYEIAVVLLDAQIKFQLSLQNPH